jgi:4,5-DOPA dioxygenase extradiol
VYPAPGHPELAARAAELLIAAGWPTVLDTERGLDHGAWVPLLYMYPEADVPVFQVSMPLHLDCASALAFGAALSPLAREGVLIVGSGSLTHNLSEFRLNQETPARYAVEFVDWVRSAVTRADAHQLANALSLAPNAQRAHPSSDHFLPLPVAFGAASMPLPATVLAGGMRYGMLSMESYVFGQTLTGL